MNIELLKTILLVITVILSIYYIIIIVSLWKILIKEDKKPWLSLIPLVNFYLLFKICRIPYWTLFVPLVNIVVIVLLPYKLARQYTIDRKKSRLLTLIPFYTFPYIAFSNLQNKDKNNSESFMKTVNDINRLEVRLNNDTDTIIDDLIDIGTKDKKTVKEESNLNGFVEQIESTIINDEYVYTEPIIEEKKNEKEVIEIEEFVDLNADEITSFKDIDTLEQNMIDETNQDKEIYESNEEFQTVGPSSAAIAFGGKQQVEDSTHAKNDALKCPRCGTSLVGANGFCPGCGNQV